MLEQLETELAAATVRLQQDATAATAVLESQLASELAKVEALDAQLAAEVARVHDLDAQVASEAQRAQQAERERAVVERSMGAEIEELQAALQVLKRDHCVPVVTVTVTCAACTSLVHTGAPG